jgi:hypothetical protein
MALIVGAMLALACAAREHGTPARAATEVAPPPPSITPKPRVTRCSARPSTLYGDEPVVFDIEGSGPSGALVEVEVLNERSHSVFRGAAAVPGQVRVADVSSGDFSLRIAGSAVTCQVTVNRELSRGSSGTR